MTRKSIQRTISYASFLVNGGQHRIAPAYSIENVQTAVNMLDRLPLDTARLFADEHIITVGEAISLMYNDYLNDHSVKSLVQMNDLKVMQKFHGSAYLQYHFVYDVALGHDRISCTVLNASEFNRLAHLISNQLGLGKQDEIKVPVANPF